MSSQNPNDTDADGKQDQPRWLPLQNLLLAAVVIAAVTGAAEALNAATGYPFGQRMSVGSETIVARQLALVMLPLFGAVALLGGRGVARLLLLPRRHIRLYGCWLLAANAGLALLPLAALDLFATQAAHWWRWRNDRLNWQGIALPNLGGWLCVNLMALLFATPALIDKRPIQPPPSLGPLAAWFALNAALLVGCASRVSDAAVAVLAAPVALFSVLAFHRHRAAVADCGGQEHAE